MHCRPGAIHDRLPLPPGGRLHPPPLPPRGRSGYPLPCRPGPSTPAPLPPGAVLHHLGVSPVSGHSPSSGRFPSLPPAEFGLPHTHACILVPVVPAGKVGGGRAVGGGPGLGASAVCAGTAVTTGRVCHSCDLPARLCPALELSHPSFSTAGYEVSTRGPSSGHGASALLRLTRVVADLGEACLSTESPGASQETDRSAPHPHGTGRGRDLAPAEGEGSSESRLGHKCPPGRCCGQRPVSWAGGQLAGEGPRGFPRPHVAGGKLRLCRGGQALEREGRVGPDRWRERVGGAVQWEQAALAWRTWLVDVLGKPVRCLGLIVSLPQPRQCWPACPFLPFPTR